MATQPHPQPKPPTPPPPSPPRPPSQPPAAHAEARTARAEDAALPIGAKPLDPKDPQAVKHDPPQPAPPRWEDDKTPEIKPVAAWSPKAALDPRAEKPPQGTYADGMGIADEQRARAAWVEANGLEKYDEATDQRPAGEKPRFDPHALAGGGAFVSAGTQKQVAGVTPPTKRE
jgi:hypothetical protein